MMDKLAALARERGRELLGADRELKDIEAAVSDTVVDNHGPLSMQQAQEIAGKVMGDLIPGYHTSQTDHMVELAFKMRTAAASVEKHCNEHADPMASEETTVDRFLEGLHTFGGYLPAHAGRSLAVELLGKMSYSESASQQVLRRFDEAVAALPAEDDEEEDPDDMGVEEGAAQVAGGPTGTEQPAPTQQQQEPTETPTATNEEGDGKGGKAPNDRRTKEHRHDPTSRGSPAP